MAGPKRVPVEVVERAKAVAAMSKEYVIAAPKKAVSKPVEKKGPREKVVAALKRLHPMD